MNEQTTKSETPVETDGQVLQARKTLLFVDDDADFLLVCKTALEPLGYRVTTACNGLESLRAARLDQKPDLVFLDVKMPGIDGLQAMKLLQDFRQRLQVPIVMCSADQERDTITRALANGARDYLTKPVAIQDLLDCIKRCL